MTLVSIAPSRGGILPDWLETGALPDHNHFFTIAGLFPYHLPADRDAVRSLVTLIECSFSMPATPHSSRFELKFRITELVAVEIKQFLRGILRKDSHTPDGPIVGYPVCSVYLDSPSAGLYRQTMAGEKNRFKLRIRVYDDDPSQPAFLEVKRRENRVICKRRAAVDRESAKAILEGAPASIADFAGNRSGVPEDWAACRDFCRLRDRLRARGSTYVKYHREAYVSPAGNPWRATFDRWLSARPYQRGEAVTIPAGFSPTSDYNAVIFELKFTDRFPAWMHELVSVFDLTAISFPKYIQCVDSLHDGRRAGDHRVNRVSATKVADAV